MIRLALLFVLSALPAQACMWRSIEGLHDHSMVQALITDGDWDVSVNSETLEATCVNCADERGFLLFAMPHNEASPRAAIIAMDREREAFCAQIATDGTGRCTASEVRNQRRLLGRSRRMDLGALTFVSDELICGEMILYAHAYATGPTEGLNELARALPSMLLYLTPNW
jgi:hypothetical protein